MNEYQLTETQKFNKLKNETIKNIIENYIYKKTNIARIISFSIKGDHNDTGVTLRFCYYWGSGIPNDYCECEIYNDLYENKELMYHLVDTLFMKIMRYSILRKRDKESE